jgi:hypothetical protein
VHIFKLYKHIYIEANLLLPFSLDFPSLPFPSLSIPTILYALLKHFAINLVSTPFTGLSPSSYVASNAPALHPTYPR